MKYRVSDLLKDEVMGIPGAYQLISYIARIKQRNRVSDMYVMSSRCKAHYKYGERMNVMETFLALEALCYGKVSGKRFVWEHGAIDVLRRAWSSKDTNSVILVSNIDRDRARELDQMRRHIEKLHRIDNKWYYKVMSLGDETGKVNGFS